VSWTLNRMTPVFATTAAFLVGFVVCSLIFLNFTSLRVVMNLFTDNALIGIVAVGLTFVIISGGTAL
jgi:galactofuranose transport system permease protein